VIDQHAPHQAGRDAEEVRAILPVDRLGADEAYERLIQQRGGLQRVPAPLAPHVGPRQSAQLRLHERRQPLEGVIVAVAPCPQ
jgi:hypothetical protein